MTSDWRRSSRSGSSGGNCVELVFMVRGDMESHAWE
ncbi:DUF397 domain-containing protein [Actinoallomurus purpureus]